MSRTLHILSGKWASRVIFELEKKPSVRFGELKAALGSITSTVLSATLKELEQQGIVIREQYPEIPPHVEYSLTSAGKAMLPIYYEAARWGMRYLGAAPDEAGIAGQKFQE